MSNRAILNWDYLTQNLQDQVSAYQDLNALLISENNILIEHRVQYLSDITYQKDQVNQNIHYLQVQFSEIMNQMMIGDNQDKKTLEWLINTAPESYRQQLRLIQRKLKEISFAVYKQNQKNKHLIEQSMKYVGHMMKKILEIEKPQQQVYCQRGYSKTLGDDRNFMNVVA